MKNKLASLCLLFLLLLSACAPQTDFDVRGEWEYTMTAADGNINDAGTIVFSGQPASGTYQQTNIYEIVYEGEYTVKGTAITLTGDETWTGSMSGSDSMSGEWVHADGSNGVWVATRKP